jgi:hypothetical protein
VQLYELRKDLQETQNLQEKHPRIVRRLGRMLEEMVARGRSTPGPELRNEGTISLYGEKE